MECPYLKECKFKPRPDPRRGPGEAAELPIYEFLVPFRCALAKKHAPENWKVNFPEKKTKIHRSRNRRFNDN